MVPMRLFSVVPLLAALACARQGTVPPQPPGPVSLQLESLYLDDGLQVGTNIIARTVSLTLEGSSDEALEGTLLLDPNACSLDAFGDPEICTLIAVSGIEVDLDHLTLTDPTGRMRRIYAVRGRGLPPDLRMIVQGRLEAGELERAYLKLGTELVPLYVEDGR